MSKPVRLEIQRLQIHIDGIVQGVGFRPFVYNLAQQIGLSGWVKNTSAGVDIDVEGRQEELHRFLIALEAEAPPLAQIELITTNRRSPCGSVGFEIAHSAAAPGAFQPISPDVSLCDDCRRELFDPDDRRYRYPFINCTNCGPRFTIIGALPYDRPYTTMAAFEMCPACRAEYQDPGNRRFHAQPIACPECGPAVWLEANGALLGRRDEAIRQTRSMLAQGAIVAIKGLGGFHLACNAMDEGAVERLRLRKSRPAKPLAVMMPDLETVRKHCIVSEGETRLLLGTSRPIVLLQRRPESAIGSLIAPGQATLGVMLPYTPLHELILEKSSFSPEALVMTSANRAGEPLEFQNNSALQVLAPFVDAFLLHDRDIHIRCDDSVLRIFESAPYPIRRARGYAPQPLRMSRKMPPILAVGAELKNTFCLTRERYAFLSQHLGDLESLESLEAFESTIQHFEVLFGITPKAIALDSHPDYLSSRYAMDRASRELIPAIKVQHHHAHLAACLAEHDLPRDEPAIGVIYDGTGLGNDGAIWGGEILVGSAESYQRAFHLRYVPLPGGDLAIRNPWRTALAWLHACDIPWDPELAPVRYVSKRHLSLFRQQIEAGVNTPLTSSMGRLFDAAASLVGVCQTASYEAQAAIELEALAAPTSGDHYSFDLHDGLLDARPLLHDLVADLRRGTDLPILSARFHMSIARMTVDACRQIRQQQGLALVALSGGVWQNMRLLALVKSTLEDEGFRVLTHRSVPANDGGLSLGQAVVAAAAIANGDSSHESIQAEPALEKVE